MSTRLRARPDDPGRLRDGPGHRHRAGVPVRATVGTFDTPSRALGRLPGADTAEQPGDMTVTRGGAVPGEEFHGGVRAPTPADPVRRIMTRNPVGVSPAATLREATREL